MRGSGTHLEGRVLDERGHPFMGLRVAALDPDVAGAPELGTSGVHKDGTYRIRLAHPPRRRVQLVVRDPWGIRDVARLPPAPLRGTLPDAKVPRFAARGWRVPVDASPVTSNNGVDMLVDGADMFRAMVDAVDRARHHVHLLQLFFEPGFTATYDKGVPRPFVDALLAALDRGVEVRVLLNQNALIPDDVDAIQDLLEGHDGARARVRGFLLAPHVMHSKLLVVDDEEAYVIGPPFQQRFWDTSGHPAEDARRGTTRPTHDLAVRLRGPVVRDVAEEFARCWNRREPADPVAVPPRPPAAGGQAVQLVRTYPGGLFEDHPEESRGILESLGRMFVEAERFVYVENQYYTSGTFNRWIDRALRAKPDLEVILLLNHAVDVPGYITWQKRRLRELGYPERDRLGVFTAWRPRRRAEGGVTLHRVYAHSKLAIADDAWASVGTANLDSISLERARDFYIPVESNVDLNVLLFDGADGTPCTGIAKDLRARTWSEFLATPPSTLREPPESGWLDVWRRHAHRDLERLRGGECPDRIVLLPYLPDDASLPGADWK